MPKQHPATTFIIDPDPDPDSLLTHLSMVLSRREENKHWTSHKHHLSQSNNYANQPNWNNQIHFIIALHETKAHGPIREFIQYLFSPWCVFSMMIWAPTWYVQIQMFGHPPWVHPQYVWNGDHLTHDGLTTSFLSMRVVPLAVIMRSGSWVQVHVRSLLDTETTMSSRPMVVGDWPQEQLNIWSFILTTPTNGSPGPVQPGMIYWWALLWEVT